MLHVLHSSGSFKKSSGCFQKYWPHLLILGTEMMAYSMILISCERFFAVLRPVKYKIIFEDRNKIYFLFLIPLATLVSFQ